MASIYADPAIAAQRTPQFDPARDARAGQSAPLGATSYADGVNFSLYSRNATRVELHLFDRADDARPSAVIGFDPAINRTYHYWHIFVSGLRPGQLYAYRLDGPF